ncbi:MAG TPA: hypothetical protein PKA27_10200 [Fimbriimonadaceae bacterium]|nr:hypothetical protein [Fimbriimonadaceae bacterium]
MNSVRAKLAPLAFLSLLSACATAQISVTDSMIYGYTDYYSGTNYGFPNSVGFADSHSGFIYSYLGPGSGPLRIDNTFGPTDESPNGNINIWVTFTALSETSIRLETGTTAYIDYNWYIFDENFNAMASFNGGLTDYVTLPAGTYTLQFDSFMNMWWAGTSYGTGFLEIFEEGYGLRPWAHTTNVGEEFEGDLEGLVASDDVRLCVFPDPSSLVAQVTFESVSPVMAPSGYRFTFEGHVARPGLSQSLTVRDFDSATDVFVDGRVASTEDLSVEINLTSNLDRYVGTGGTLSSTVTWMPINDEDPAVDGWLHCVDQVRWWLDR